MAKPLTLGVPPGEISQIQHRSRSSSISLLGTKLAGGVRHPSSIVSRADPFPTLRVGKGSARATASIGSDLGNDLYLFKLDLLMEEDRDSRGRGGEAETPESLKTPESLEASDGLVPSDSGCQEGKEKPEGQNVSDEKVSEGQEELPGNQSIQYGGGKCGEGEDSAVANESSEEESRKANSCAVSSGSETAAVSGAESPELTMSVKDVRKARLERLRELHLRRVSAFIVKV